MENAGAGYKEVTNVGVTCNTDDKVRQSNPLKQTGGSWKTAVRCPDWTIYAICGGKVKTYGVIIVDVEFYCCHKSWPTSDW